MIEQIYSQKKGMDPNCYSTWSRSEVFVDFCRIVDKSVKSKIKSNEPVKALFLPVDHQVFMFPQS